MGLRARRAEPSALVSRCDDCKTFQSFEVLRGLRLLTPVAAFTRDCKYTHAILRCAGSDEVPTVSRNSHYRLASIIATHTRTNKHTHNFFSLPRFFSFSDTRSHTLSHPFTHVHHQESATHTSLHIAMLPGSQHNYPQHPLLHWCHHRTPFLSQVLLLCYYYHSCSES